MSGDGGGVKKRGRPSSVKDNTIGALYNVNTDVLYVSDRADDIPAVFNVATISKVVITEEGATYTIRLLGSGECVEEVSEEDLTRKIEV